MKEIGKFSLHQLLLASQKAASDWEGGGAPMRRSQGPPPAAVRFFDDMGADGHLHDLHQSVRDVSSGHARLERDVNHLVDRTNR